MQITTDYTFADFVWSYERNEKLMSMLTLKDKEKRESETPLTGDFILDYIRNCTVLGILPHPSIASQAIKLEQPLPPPEPVVEESKGMLRYVSISISLCMLVSFINLCISYYFIYNYSISSSWTST